MMIKLLSFLLFFSLIIPLNSCQKKPSSIDNSISNNDKLISITDASNTVLKIKQIPQKIVCLHLSCIDILTELNHPPVAVHHALLSLAQSDIYFGEAAKNILPIGGYGEPNLEQLLKIKPDLIIGHMASYGNQRETLSSIAPLFLIEVETYQDALNNLETFANLLNKQEEFTKAKSNFLDKINSYKNQATKDKTVLVTNGTEGNFFIATQESLVGSLLSELAQYPWTVGNNISSAINWINLSSEEILQVNPDVIFVLVKSPSPDLLNKLKKDSFWKQLKAVKNNQIYALEDEKIGGLTTGTKSLSAFADEIMPLLYPQL
jgi:iron complex transport system substrate-binding protein